MKFPVKILKNGRKMNKKTKQMACISQKSYSEEILYETFLKRELQV